MRVSFRNFHRQDQMVAVWPWARQSRRDNNLRSEVGMWRMTMRHTTWQRRINHRLASADGASAQQPSGEGSKAYAQSAQVAIGRRARCERDPGDGSASGDERWLPLVFLQGRIRRHRPTRDNDAECPEETSAFRAAAKGSTGTNGRIEVSHRRAWRPGIASSKLSRGHGQTWGPYRRHLPRSVGRAVAYGSTEG